MLDHLSLHCPYARAIWAGLVTRLGLPDITPTGDLGINVWWLQATARFTRVDHRSANCLIMLTLRLLWLERNARVFEDKRLPHAVTLEIIIDEWHAWVRAGPGVVVGCRESERFSLLADTKMALGTSCCIGGLGHLCPFSLILMQ
jgi:hypothetical protein